MSWCDRWLGQESRTLLKGHMLLLSVLVTVGPAGVVTHLRRRCGTHHHSSCRLGDLNPWEEAWPGSHLSFRRWEAAQDLLKSVPPAQATWRQSGGTGSGAGAGEMLRQPPLVGVPGPSLVWEPPGASQSRGHRTQWHVPPAPFFPE